MTMGLQLRPNRPTKCMNSECSFYRKLVIISMYKMKKFKHTNLDLELAKLRAEKEKEKEEKE